MRLGSAVGSVHHRAILSSVISPTVTIEQIATDFGIHPMTQTKWMRQAAIDDGDRPGKSTTDSVELRELRRRNRLLEQAARSSGRANSFRLGVSRYRSVWATYDSRWS